MKNTKQYISTLFGIAVLLLGCDKDFDEINTNKVDPTSLNAAFGMNNSIINSLFTNTVGVQSWFTYPFPIVQQALTPFGSSVVGANYNQLNINETTRLWNQYYPNVVKDIVDVVNKTKDDPDQSNLYNSARIWKVYVFLVLTDTYGDIPYFEAGKGFLEGVLKPKYDAQEAIYNDFLKELEEAGAALDTSLPIDRNEIMYGGDIVKWKKLANSLMLRVAMRLSKVNPSLAQNYVVKAVEGGLMESNEDNALLAHSADYRNWIGETLNGREKATFFMGEPFVDYLQENDDPRLPVLAIRYVGANNGNQQVAARATTDPALQIGMPFGYDAVSIASIFAEKNVVSIWDFTQINRTTVVTINSPEYFVTHSQTQLLLAEAIVQNWVPGDASAAFSNGIRAHMEQLADNGPDAIISEDDIQAYLSTHPLDMSDAINQINTQYWVSSFLDGREVWSNFRRSGFPLLTPNPYPGSELSGDFINRFPYPNSEYVVNIENVQEAVSRQGTDDLDTKVWWHVE